MLGSWYVHGYEGATRAERRKFYSQRDDPCESDHETDQQLSCFRRRKRLRKVRRRGNSALGNDARVDDEDDDKDAYDLVETSCSSSNKSDGDMWGFEDQLPHDDISDAEHHECDNDEEGGSSSLWKSHHRGPKVDHRFVHCIPKLTGVPALVGASSAVLFEENRCAPTAVLLHGGLPLPTIKPDSRRTSSSIPSNRSYFLIRSADQKGWIATPVVAPTQVVLLHHPQHSLSGHHTNSNHNTQMVVDMIPPQSLKRWTRRTMDAPHRFGHCTATLPTSSIPVHNATMLEQWNALLPSCSEGEVGPDMTKGEGPFDSLDVSMTVTLGGCGEGVVPTVANSRAARHQQLEGCMLTEPILQLHMRLRREVDGCCVLWSSSVRLMPEVSEGHMTPRAFFSINPYGPHHRYSNGSSPPSLDGGVVVARVPSSAAFLVFGGTEDGTTPLDDGGSGGVLLLSIDTTERTFSLEPFSTLGAPPHPRFGHTMTMVDGHSSSDDTHHAYVLHGGVGYMGIVFSDVHLLDGASRVWREIIVPVGDAVIARPRAFHAAWCCGGRKPNGGGPRSIARILFSGGESGEGAAPNLDIATVAFYPWQQRWATVSCPLLDVDPIEIADPHAHELQGAAVLPSTPGFEFHHQQLGESRAARGDMVLRDILQLAKERQSTTTTTRTALGGGITGLTKSADVMNATVANHRFGTTIGGVCHGSMASAVVTAQDGGSAWMFGGTQNLHRTHMSATQMRRSDGTLKEAAAVWLLLHEARSTASEHHARRLSANAQLKAWCSMV
ncbi:Hypothetical protein, putative [Bodo saltans]|uniref:Uncharacterized protein n=1 Tax=Bodo saltans TaxID=75058 RepID=A0A0S4J0D9_BODSA|nr:Hypothetical protein, putative [Bodo saltans]|eukprot:CUG36788.1 Hypothetical protein, putative [Bodo saltans]